MMSIKGYAVQDDDKCAAKKWLQIVDFGYTSLCRKEMTPLF